MRKTIEAGIVLCQFWAERKRRLLVICPASIRKQWALELAEKCNLASVVLDAKAYREATRAGRDPLAPGAVLVVSFNFANSLRDDLKAIAWDLVVIDEAHKLRNAYRPSNKVGQGIRWATEDCRKLLLTATPLQAAARLVFSGNCGDARHSAHPARDTSRTCTTGCASNWPTQRPSSTVSASGSGRSRVSCLRGVPASTTTRWPSISSGRPAMTSHGVVTT